MEEIDYKALYEEEVRKRKEIEKQQEEDAKKRAAEKQEEEERKLKEIEKNQEEASKKREEAEKRADLEHQISHTLAIDDLKRPLPSYLEPSSSQLTTTEGTDLVQAAPKHVTKWLNFDQEINNMLSRIGDRKIKRISDPLNWKNTGLENYSNVHIFVQSVLWYMMQFFDNAQICVDQIHNVSFGDGSTLTQGGIPDIVCKLNAKIVFLAEVKRVTVIFQSEKDDNIHPADLYNSSSNELCTKNTKTTLLQTYSYMISKGNIKYGLFTNYEQWCFLRRYITSRGEEALEVSKYYSSSGTEKTFSARQALACFMSIVFEEKIHILEPGEMEAIESRSNADAREEEVEGNEKDQKGPAATTTTTTTSETKIQTSSTRQQQKFFSVGTCVNGFEFVTTKSALNIQSLSAHAPESIILSASEKATTFHGHVGNAHLVWRQIDIYGLPKHNSDFRLDALQDMVTQETKVYRHLRPFWGILVPQFIYFGQDFNMLWVFVTSYEGVSLRTLVKDNGGLDKDMKQKARNKLIAIHEQGVIHGDPVLRNALYRETDGEVIWIDMEFAKVFAKKNDRFTKLALAELEELDRELASVTELVPSDLKRARLTS